MNNQLAVDLIIGSVFSLYNKIVKIKFEYKLFNGKIPY